MSPHEDPNLTWERHFNTTCRQVAPKKKGPATCPVPGCKEKMGPSNRYECKHCHQTVCMKHRMQEDHDCAPPGARASFVQGGPRRPAQPPAPREPASRRPQNATQQASAPREWSDDARLAWQLQQEEVAAAQHGGLAPPPEQRAGAPGRKPKKKISDRVLGLFTCWKGGPKSPRPGDGLLR